MLNNYLHMFFLNKGADPWPQSQGGCSLGGIPEVLLPSNSVESQGWAPCVANGKRWTPQRPQRGGHLLPLAVSTKGLKEPHGNWYLSLKQIWVRGRNPKTCFLSTQSQTDCRHYFNSVLVCVATLFFLYLVSKYESCNGYYILYCHSWKRILYAVASREGLF